ncbi:Uu.00g041480.m01.CDS01 [Anthostomella pinea]|uniref:Uu.00g041480.m01.CDS01 n=1 Tax=Anthostomella pinea TaxID=933095 RepID=A0AAI8VBC8_9PEZI|nr:Uu.00g041480.m01.CDS01 [Anthostomella pinea]
MAELFDFIVVGAGPAGCVIASRLAKTPAKPSVLLVEAGGANENMANLSGAERFEIAFREGSPLNWFYKTEPQVKGQVIDYSRGKGLGGSTAINFCGWVVGADDDYDEWARLVGDEAFAWKHVKQCLKKIENFHNDVPQKYRKWFKPKDEDHGIGGAVDISYQAEWLDICDDLFIAAEQTPGFGINTDVNAGNPIGMGIGTACIYSGIRVTSSSAYLQEVTSNLTITTNQQVEKVIVEGGVATGIKTIDGSIFRAKNDVVLCAGALNSPHILLLSGIGPKEQLEQHGVAQVKQMPEVGQNLQDHCFGMAGIVVKKKCDQNFKQSPTPMGWFKVPATLSSDEFKELPTAMQEYLNRPNVPNWEFATLTPFFEGTPLEPDEEVFSGICMMMNPQSRGTVTLKSSDPKDAPLIDPKFLTHPFDKLNAIESMREMLRYMQTPIWKDKTTRTLGWPRDDTDEAVWEAYSSNLRSSWHMCGTVRMGLDDASCVDSSFRVYGIGRLRVADMSVCPLIPNNHSQTTAYVIGELAAEKLVAEHGLDSS